MAEPAEAEHLGDAVCAIGGTSTMEDMQQDKIKDQEAQDQQNFANRLKVAKVHELAFLKQRQIVTRAVQSLEQLHLELSVQTHKTSKSSRKENGSGDTSAASTSLESATTSSSSFSSSSRASSIIVDAEISSDPDDTRYEDFRCITAATDSQSVQQQQQQQEHPMTAVQQTLQDVQEQATADAAAAAAVAALQGITRGQAHNYNRPRKGPQHVWNGSSRQFSTALNKAIAAAAQGGRWPGETREDSLADSPRSTSTTTSSRTSSSRAASSKPDVRRPKSNQPSRHAEGDRSVSRTQQAAFDADSPPPGFGFQTYDSSRSVAAGKAASTYQHAAHSPVQSGAPHPVHAAAQAPPGFAPAAPPLPPPGFAGARRAAGGSGYSPQTRQSRMSSPSAASHAGRTPTSGRAAQSRRVGQSRLFQGAMAGAVAERG